MSFIVRKRHWFRGHYRALKQTKTDKTSNSTALKEYRHDIRSHHGNSKATDSGVFSCGGVLEWGMTAELLFLEGLSCGRKILEPAA